MGRTKKADEKHSSGLGLSSTRRSPSRFAAAPGGEELVDERSTPSDRTKLNEAFLARIRKGEPIRTEQLQPCRLQQICCSIIPRSRNARLSPFKRCNPVDSHHPGQSLFFCFCNRSGDNNVRTNCLQWGLLPLDAVCRTGFWSRHFDSRGNL